MASVLLFVFFLLSHFVLLLPAQGKMIYTERCPPFRCGHLGDIHFPFANKTNPECGVLTVDCGGPNPTIQLAANQQEDGERRYEVLNLSQNNTMSSIRIVDVESGEQLKSDKCEFFTNLTLTNSSFISFEIATPNQTFFKCDRPPYTHPPTNFKEMSCNDYSNFHSRISSDNLPTYFSGCSIVHPQSPGDDDMFNFLALEFDLGVRVSEDCYKCYRGGGQCKGKPNDNWELYCDGEREKGIDLRITKQYLGIHAYIHENAYKFVSFYVVFIHNSTCAAIISVPCHNPLL
jgi:hypothetical protein